MRRLSTENGNSYENIAGAMNRLGFSVKGENDYKDKFGLALKARAPVLPERLLQADAMPLNLNQDLLVNLAQAMELSIKEIAMVVDMPAYDSGASVIYVAAKAQASQRTTKNALNKLGVCSEYRANANHSVSPMDSAVHYFQKYKKGPEVEVLKPNGVLGFQTDSKLIVVKPPMHGSLMLSMPDATENNLRKYNYQYIPNKDYVGLDNFDFEVSLNGKSLRIYYQIEVYAEDVNMNHVGYCNWDNQKYYRKISQSGQPDALSGDLAAWQRSANLSALIASAQQTLAGFTDLPGTALGQTIGEGAFAQINLDQNAAGHGWYGDPTPLDSADDYLPTSNPAVWQAKAGSAAAEMTPTAEVKKDSKNMLNVLKVEQRLKCLRFSAMKTGTENTIKDFSVDGNFDTKETAELKLFEKVVRYESSGNSARYAPASTGADGLIESASSGQAKITKDWLNAYNAPHWMQYFAGTGASGTAPKFQARNGDLPGWKNTQIGTRTGNVEIFGTSWMRDLMVAKQFAPPQLVKGSSWFNGTTDANHKYTPTGHASHDLGMAMDLGVSNYIDATRNFLSLYNLTRQEQTATANNGTWEELEVSTAERSAADVNRVRTALFGDGSAVGNLIQSAWIGGNANTNTWPQIRSVLDQLGISNRNMNPHEHHFHVDFRTPVRLPLTTRLLTTDVAIIPFDNVRSDSSRSLLLSNAQQFFDQEMGAAVMIPVNIPEVPPSDAMLPVIFVQADASMISTAALPGKTLTVGHCVVYSSSTAPDDTPYGSGPVAEAAMALNRVFGRKMIDLDNPVKAEATVVSQPTHGKLMLNKFPDGGTTYDYRSNIGYLGKETFTLLVKIEGQPPVKIIYFFKIVDGGPDDAQIKQYCGTTKIKFWKISQSGEPDALTGDLPAWQRNATLSALIASAQQSLVGFTDLPGTALGQTTGHGWYGDPTPLDSTDDYLLTNQSTVWQAKAASAAAGKMDMLSVLLHEYGHALGLEHSADSSDYMAASLQPGQRKLPSTEELALMARLVADLKTEQYDPTNPFTPSPLSVLGLLPLGLMRRTGAGTAAGMSTSTTQTSHTDYLTAINPTLTNGNFTIGQNGSVNQWETTGKVNATSSTFTQSESTTAQTHLAQAFVISAQDRFLVASVNGYNKGLGSLTIMRDAQAAQRLPSCKA